MKRKAMDVADLSRIPTCAEFARLKQELESLRAKLPKWHRCDEPDEDGFFDLPPESGSYFAQYETTWADGTTKRYCEPLEYDADPCDRPQPTNPRLATRWCESPEPPEDFP